MNGPFRHSSNSGNEACQHSNVWYEDNQYSVRFDFELHVPAATKIMLSTINEGDIKVERVSGGFDLHNVNGGIELSEAAGSGNVHTVNGKISATFTRNPANGTSFKTVNGTIEASFRPNLAADVWLKTMNGGAYTDFPATALANMPATAERRDGKFVYRGNRSSTVRIGAGGPEYKFETLNGSIRIINRGQ